MELVADPDALECLALRRAVQFLHDHADQRIGVKDIAGAGYLSPRAIQYVFRQQLGATPIGYLQRVRLERVHEELTTCDPFEVTVVAAATHWHAYHPGRFAASYRQAFGENPGDTLRRRRLARQPQHV